MTLLYDGKEYIVVKDWEPDEKLAYRETGHNHIEILNMFCGVVHVATVHLGMLKLVLEHREYLQDVNKSEQQQLLNHEIIKAIEEETA
ncbi:hypothetical protein ABNB59_14745 [Paenibacillus larvae]|uniref:Uncharacterized protein n=4 Tax=root TaxID=1 RepID=A0A0K2CYP7_9CAUD|nr:hypothetical protein [Paenibacillus larvae]YP_009193872.1 hypothetical protein HARRISON_59 [Paenibacillus phage Harrison]ALA12620.1 hypothetical protein PAISLEY_59 [Paenibacillus phage Paisley]QVV19452.1 hypothetical protein Bert_50 [Paenibacillus phage Bert]QVV19853.1 hypothetical protein Mock2_50 [Paenibacillus phage Mock2]UYL93241.1 hypothetical protein CALLAN_51 [Paenibacillus phage Callan]UYL93319.1 hypothetical protein DASH_53 [Paenibacillus phage Dash]